MNDSAINFYEVGNAACLKYTGCFQKTVFMNSAAFKNSVPDCKPGLEQRCRTCSKRVSVEHYPHFGKAAILVTISATSVTCIYNLTFLASNTHKFTWPRPRVQNRDSSTAGCGYNSRDLYTGDSKLPGPQVGPSKITAPPKSRNLLAGQLGPLKAENWQHCCCRLPVIHNLTLWVGSGALEDCRWDSNGNCQLSVIHNLTFCIFPGRSVSKFIVVYGAVIHGRSVANFITRGSFDSWDGKCWHLTSTSW